MERQHGGESRRNAVSGGPLTIAILSVVCPPAVAQTWSMTPGSGDWDVAANWAPANVPDGSSVTAEFGASTITDLRISTEFFGLDTLRLNADAGAYTFDLDGTNVGLALFGAGVDNLSASPATFLLQNGGTLALDNAATVADSAIFNESGSLLFFSSSTADAANIATGDGGRTQFYDDTSAATAELVTNEGGLTEFLGSSSAGSATIVTNSSGRTVFHQSSTAGAATLLTNSGGELQFNGNSSAGDASIDTAGGGQMSISSLASSGMAAGSIDGMGSYVLGSKNLEVGGLNSDMNVGGIISGSGGSITKVGSGMLSLTGANTYTGGTLIAGGGIRIFADNNLGAATGRLTFDGGVLRTMLGVTMTREVTLETGGGTIDTGSVSSTLAGAIDGSGSLTKLGNGTLTLTGANSYSGGTTLAAGTLIGNTASLQGDITNNGGTLIFDQGTDGTYSGAMSGTGGTLVKRGGGTVTLSGTSAYSGAVRVNSGTLLVSGADISGLTGISLGQLATEEGTLQVSGSTSSVQTTNAANLVVGGAGTGTLRIDDGGSMRAGISVVGSSAGSDGTVVVSGADSLFENIGGIAVVGMFGRGSLTIADGAEVHASNTLYLGFRDGSSGTLNIGAGAGAGTLVAATVRGGSGPDVANDATVVFDHTESAYSFAPSLTGTLNVDHNGAGTTILTGGNTYLGTTTLNAGTLAISANNNLGAATGTLAFGGGTLRTDAALSSGRGITLQSGGGTIDTNGFDSTFSGAIGGSGSLIKTGLGTLALTGENTYTGGTSVLAGTLRGDASSLQGAIANEASVVFDQADDGTYAGVMTGAGTLTKVGAGTLTLSGENTYTGGTSVLAGTLRGDASSLQGAIANEASVVFDQADDGTYAGVMTGAGTLTKLGMGTLTLAGENSYSGGTTIDAGTLSISADSNLGAEDGAITFNGGILRATDSFSIARETTLQSGGGAFEVAADNMLTVSSGLTGSGGLRKLGAGTLTLTGNNDYSGGTTISAGTLSISADRNLGAAGGTITFDGGALQVTDTFAIDRETTLQPGGGAFDVSADNTLTMDSAISGSGGLHKLGEGTLRLRGESAYLGDTIVTAGALEGDSRSLHGNIVNDARLVFMQDIDGTYDGALSGSGTLTKSGTGNLVLRGAHTYTGATTVERGILSVNGTLASPVNVGSSARLTGTGRIDNSVTVGDGAELTAGDNSIGVLTIGGPLTLAPGSRMIVEADLAGNADRIDVVGPQGSVLIEGGTLRLQATGEPGSYERDTTYRVLTSTGGIEGEFDLLTTNLAFLTPTVSYDATAVEVSLNRNGVSYSDVAETDNQSAVAGYLDELADDGGLRSIVRSFDAMSEPQARTTLGQLGGDGLSGLGLVSIGTTARLQTMLLDRLGAANDVNFASVPDARDARYPAGTDLTGGGIWMRLIGADGDTGGDGNATGYSWTSTGTAAGVDVQPAPRMRLGASLLYTRTDLEFDGAGLGGSEITTPRGAAYGSYTWSRPSVYRRNQRSYTRLRAVLGYASHRYDTQRNVAFGTYTSTAHASHGGREWSALTEVELIEDLGSLRLHMLYGLRYIQLNEDGYSESGGLANLSVDRITTRSIVPRAGIKVVNPEFMSRGVLELRTSWSRELRSDPPALRGRLVEASNDALFTVTGASAAQDVFSIGAGISMEIADELLLSGSYDAEIRRNRGVDRWAILGVSYSW